LPDADGAAFYLPLTLTGAFFVNKARSIAITLTLGGGMFYVFGVGPASTGPGGAGGGLLGVFVRL
jgi:hypothetical protein